MNVRHFPLPLLLLSFATPLQAAEDSQLATDAFAVLQKSCFRCHGGSAGKNAGLDVLDSASLLQQRGDGDIEAAFVVPGKPDGSLLWQAVESGYMPLDGSQEAEKITDEDRAVIKKWIAAGAPAPQRRKVDVVSEGDVLKAIRDHLFRADARDREYLRFFTLAHLHNNPRVLDRDMRLHRAALAKLLNSLIWRKKKFVELSPVKNTSETVYVIDVREMDWDEGNLWRRIVDHYPYGFHHQFAEDRSLRQLYDDIYRLSGSRMPHVRADWFIVYAAQPPLYNVLLDLPKSTEELARRLGVKDINANILRGKVARAGFTRSGVSQQNRLIERHESSDGAFWISYDFKPRKARGDLVRFPLGPKFEGNPFNGRAFDHDGGEIIFSLPNGLQGYMLVKGDGTRLDEPAPADVVYDSAAVTGSPAIINGLSCMNCHAKGMISRFRDEIRDARAVAGPLQQHVEEIYPTNDDMQKLVKEDEQRFLAALDRVVKPFLKPEDQGEPIGKVASRYYGDLGPQEAALELGLKNGEALRVLINANEKLRELGLGVLAQTPPGTLKRAKWETVEGTSLFHDIVVHAQRGVMPIQPGALRGSK